MSMLTWGRAQQFGDNSCAIPSTTADSAGWQNLANCLFSQCAEADNACTQSQFAVYQQLYASAGGNPNAIPVPAALTNDPWANTSTSYTAPAVAPVYSPGASIAAANVTTTPVLAQGPTAIQVGCSSDPNCAGSTDASGNFNYNCNTLTGDPTYTNSPCYNASLATFAAEQIPAYPASGTVTSTGQVATAANASPYTSLVIASKAKANWPWLLLGIGAVAAAGLTVKVVRDRRAQAARGNLRRAV